jgi:hypothetical protein
VTSSPPVQHVLDGSSKAVGDLSVDVLNGHPRRLDDILALEKVLKAGVIEAVESTAGARLFVQELLPLVEHVLYVDLIGPDAAALEAPTNELA